MYNQLITFIQNLSAVVKFKLSKKITITKILDTN